MKTKLLLSATVAMFALPSHAQFGTYLDGTALNGFTFSQIRSVGIGDFSLANPTEARLHVRNSLLNQPTSGTYNGFLFRTDGFDNVDNSWRLFTENGGTFSEIFKLETPASTTNLLFQTTQTTGNMLFNTGGANQRAVITSAGLMGINEATPGNFLHITSSTTGASGLRFGNMTSATTPGSNPGSGVLTVDSNGDVILVTDGGGGSVTGQNGLSNLSANVLELGGDAANPTQVAASALSTNRELPLGSFDMLWSGNGRFNVSSVSPFPFSTAISSQLNFHNTEYNSSLFARTDASSNPGLMTTYAGWLDNLTINGYDNIGLRVKSVGDAGSAGGQFYSTSTGATASSNGVVGEADGGRYSYGGVFTAKPTSGNPTGTQQTFGVTGSATDGTILTYGVFGEALGDQSPTKYGVFGTVPHSEDGVVSYGVHGNATGGNTSAYTNSRVYGVHGTASLAQHNFGVYGDIGQNGVGDTGYAVCGNGRTLGAFNTIYGGFFSGSYNYGNMPTTNMGVFAKAPINPMITSYAGYFDGDVFVNGTATSPSGPYLTSDKAIKKDIKDIEGASTLLSKIKPKTYHLTNENVPQLKMDEDRLQYGVIAQEIEEVMPEVVREITVAGDFDKESNSKAEAKRLKSVNYTALVPLLIAAFNEQKQTVDELKEEVAKLKSQITTTTTSGTTPQTVGETTLSVTLSDNNILVLNQNVPNPFAESTNISYNIPGTFTTAELAFNTIDGKFVKSLTITRSGRGSVTVFAADLSNGIYTYSLIIDGKVMDTKKMIKQ